VVKCEGSLLEGKGKTHYMVMMMYGAKLKEHGRKHNGMINTKWKMEENKNINIKRNGGMENEGK